MNRKMALRNATIRAWPEPAESQAPKNSRGLGAGTADTQTTSTVTGACTSWRRSSLGRTSIATSTRQRTVRSRPAGPSTTPTTTRTTTTLRTSSPSRSQSTCDYMVKNWQPSLQRATSVVARSLPSERGRAGARRPARSGVAGGRGRRTAGPTLGRGARTERVWSVGPPMLLSAPGRGSAHRYASSVRPLGRRASSRSSKELTRTEAAKVIDALEAQAVAE